MEFIYQQMFPMGEDKTEYRLVTKDYVSTGEFEGLQILKVDQAGLRLVARQAMHDVSFMLRPAHNEMVAKILRDPQASDNDRAVALTMLLNADVTSKARLPFCQDTGTAIIVAKKGERVWSGGGDEESLYHGVYDTYTTDNLRYSQTV